MTIMVLMRCDEKIITHPSVLRTSPPNTTTETWFANLLFGMSDLGEIYGFRFPNASFKLVHMISAA